MITLIPSEIHHDLLNALGSTLLTLALAGGGILIVVLKSTTEISPAKSRLFTLLSSGGILGMQLVLYANQTGAGLQAILMVTLGLLCCANQCSVVRTTTTLAGVIGWLTWAGTQPLSPENTELSDQVVLIQNPHVGQFAISTVVIKSVPNHKAVWNFEPNEISFDHRRASRCLRNNTAERTSIAPR